jgi:hypothetical protein
MECHDGEIEAKKKPAVRTNSCPPDGPFREARV